MVITLFDILEVDERDPWSFRYSRPMRYWVKLTEDDALVLAGPDNMQSSQRKA